MLKNFSPSKDSWIPLINREFFICNSFNDNQTQLWLECYPIPTWISWTKPGPKSFSIEYPGFRVRIYRNWNQCVLLYLSDAKRVWILCSDGFWDVVNSRKAMQIVHQVTHSSKSNNYFMSSPLVTFVYFCRKEREMLRVLNMIQPKGLPKRCCVRLDHSARRTIRR